LGDTVSVEEPVSSANEPTAEIVVPEELDVTVQVKLADPVKPAESVAVRSTV
jgi:hypothetical protein